MLLQRDTKKQKVPHVLELLFQCAGSPTHQTVSLTLESGLVWPASELICCGFWIFSHQGCSFQRLEVEDSDAFYTSLSITRTWNHKGSSKPYFISWSYTSWSMVSKARFTGSCTYMIFLSFSVFFFLFYFLIPAEENSL